MDLKDLTAGKLPATKVEYKARIRALVKTNESKIVARNLVRGLRKVCGVVARSGRRHPKA